MESESKKRFVIIGGGVAGTMAAEELRRRDATADIVLVSEEDMPLYSRVLLPNYIEGKMPRERLFLKKETWHEQMRIEFLGGMRAQALDVRNKSVTLSDGREIPYDKLLICTGTEPAQMGQEMRGISYLRTLADADHLLQLLKEKGSKARAAIYGGSFIACEYLNMFVRMGLHTTLVMRGEGLWGRALDTESRALLHTLVKDHRVELVTAAQWIGVAGEEEITALRTSAGETPCDILGMGVGVAPELGWVREAGIEVQRGMVVDEFLQTNVADVYAAGDVAEAYDVSVGRHLCFGNWLRATMHGRTAAANMLGAGARFALVTSYAMNVLGKEVIFVGDTDPKHAHARTVQGSAAQGGVTQWFLRDERVVGATIIGRNKDRGLATRLIESREKIEVRELASERNPS